MLTHLYTLNSSKRLVQNQRGMSIMEVIIASGIMGIMSLAFTSMITTQQKQVKLMELKLAQNETSNFIQSAFKDNATCSNQFLKANDGTFKSLASYAEGKQISNPGVVDLSDSTTDLTKPSSAKIYLNKVFLGANATSQLITEVGKPLPGLSVAKVKSIYIGDFVRTDNADDTKYTANLVINLDSISSGFTTLKPINLKMNVQTTTGDIHARSLASCTTSDAGGGGELPSGSVKVFNETNCPSGYTLIQKKYAAKTCSWMSDGKEYGLFKKKIPTLYSCTTKEGYYAEIQNCSYGCKTEYKYISGKLPPHNIEYYIVDCTCVGDTVLSVMCLKN